MRRLHSPLPYSSHTSKREGYIYPAAAIYNEKTPYAKQYKAIPATIRRPVSKSPKKSSQTAQKKSIRKYQRRPFLPTFATPAAHPDKTG
jgi:hypothetical protein